MRFKIILFPLAVLICVFVSIKWIWPEITHYEELTKGRTEKQKILDSHNSEKSKIESLRNDIDANKSKETVALNYFPVQRNEENIVNTINYLATNSSVKLNDLSLEEKVIAQTTSVSSSQDVPTSKDALFASGSGNTSGQTETASPPKFVNSKIKISGTYQNIKIFLNQIYKMPIFIKVNSLTIAKPAETADAAKTDSLDLDVDASFAYKPFFVIKENYALPSFPNGSFDFSYIQKIEDSSVKVTNVSDSGVNSTGRENPFLP
jgi:Tfp pilus assembly protein PilO